MKEENKTQDRKLLLGKLEHLKQVKLTADKYQSIPDVQLELDRQIEICKREILKMDLDWYLRKLGYKQYAFIGCGCDIPNSATHVMLTDTKLDVPRTTCIDPEQLSNFSNMRAKDGTEVRVALNIAPPSIPKPPKSIPVPVGPPPPLPEPTALPAPPATSDSSFPCGHKKGNMDIFRDNINKLMSRPVLELSIHQGQLYRIQDGKKSYIITPDEPSIQVGSTVRLVNFHAPPCEVIVERVTLGGEGIVEGYCVLDIKLKQD